MSLELLDEQAIKELLLNDHWPKLKEIPDVNTNLHSVIIIEFSRWLAAWHKELVYRKPYRKALLRRAQIVHFLMGKWIETYMRNMQGLENSWKLNNLND